VKIPRLLERIAAVALVGVCIAVLSPVFLPARPATAQTGQDRVGASVQNARRIANAFLAYAQDNDENFPPFTPQAQFEEALAPYAGGITQLRQSLKSPAARNARFTLNPAFNGTSLASLTPDNEGLIEVLRDSVPPIDGKLLIAYLDGYVTRGGQDIDPIRTSVRNAKRVIRALQMYIQDYDETFPPFTPVAQFEEAMGPYVGGVNAFRRIMKSPSAGNARFQLNPIFDGASLASLPGFDLPETLEVLRDSALPSDGQTLVGFWDGHVERGGVEYDPPAPEDVSLSRGRRLGTGILLYAQDYDETFPPMTNYAEFKTVTFPYVKSNLAYTLPPANTAPWVLNTALSGVMLGSLSNPAETELARDPIVRADGKITVVYADGHVVRIFP
jgi:prepilin-type processing-associated H-X9-DG protein